MKHNNIMRRGPTNAAANGIITQRPAFTLIELLTVMAIVGVLTAVAVPSYAAIRNSVAFSGAADELVNNLRTTQSQAITSQGGSTTTHTIDFVNTTTYKVLSGATVVKEITLPNGIEFKAVPTDIIFTRLIGTATLTPITLKIGSREKTITVDANGRIW